MQDLLTFSENPKHILLVIMNIPVFFLYYKIIFGSRGNLMDSFNQSSQSDIVSLCKGSLLDDWWHTAKLVCWVYLCYKTVNFEYLYFFG